MVVNHPQRGEEERAGRVEWVCSETCCYALEAAHLLHHKVMGFFSQQNEKKIRCEIACEETTGHLV